MKWKIILTLTALLFCSSSALAQPSQEMPHRVFGTVEDTQGNTVTDTEVEVVFSGENLASDTTDENGYYDITIPYREDYSSEEVQIQVSGNQADSFTYSSGEVEEKDLTAEVSGNQEQEGSSGGSSGGGGFGGGTLPPQDNQDNETVNNSTETGNETIQEQDNSTTEETTDTSDEGGNEGTTNSSEDGNDSTGSENSLTGMFTSSTSSIGEMFTGFFDAVLSSVMSLFS